MIPVANPEIGEEELENVIRVVKSGWIGSKGNFLKIFERDFASYIGVRHAIAVSNGTAALHLALVALGIGVGDEVLVPDLTFASPANMVILSGARPIFVDVSKDYWCIDPEDARKKITRKTRAIIVVHIYGHPAKMDEIIELAEEYDLYIIEDCAEAHGAEFKNKKVGSLGTVGCFSFYANKIITTGEGGMVVTNSDKLAEKIRILRDHGMKNKRRYWHEVIGFNYRMTNLQAAIGVAQLRKIDKLIKRKIEIAKIYRDILGNVKGITLHPSMRWAKCVYWLYSILIDKEKYGMSRDKLVAKLKKYKVETRRFFYPLHIMPPYKQYLPSDKLSFPNSEMLSMKGLNLPSGPKISDEKVTYVAELIRKWSNKK